MWCGCHQRARTRLWHLSQRMTLKLDVKGRVAPRPNLDITSDHTEFSIHAYQEQAGSRKPCAMMPHNQLTMEVAPAIDD